MATHTITIRLQGTLPWTSFVKGVDHFSDFIRALANEIAGDKLTLTLDDLNYGSAAITLRAVSDDEQLPAQFVGAYRNVGQALANGTTIPYSTRVVREAEQLVGLLGRDISGMSFETDGDVSEIKRPYPALDTPDVMVAYGAVEGRIETISIHDGHRFTLFDSLHQRAVLCFLPPGSPLDDLLGQRALVYGLVEQEWMTGRPLRIRSVSKIEPIPDVPPESYREVRGLFSRSDVLPEDFIRQLRDGE